MKKLAALILTIVLTAFSSCSLPFDTKEVSIETLPPEAEIYIGVEFYGLTPKTIDAPANSEISIRMDGYKEEQYLVSGLKNGSLLKTRLKKYHEVMLNYQPDGTKVYEDGVMLGKTPFVIQRIASKVNLIAKHEYHFDFEDSFDVNGPVIRARNLKPKVRYFPDTECMISTDPQGMKVLHLGIKDGNIDGKLKELGVTPLNISNAELFKLSSERLLILEGEDFLPSVILCEGSFSAHIKMVKMQKQKMEVPKDFASMTSFVAGEITNSKVTLMAVPEEGKFKISNPNFGVSIVDLETNLTKVSGAGFYKDRFFVVRTSDPMSYTKYIAYDTLLKKRVRFENMTFFRELDVVGDIAYRQRVPIVKGKIEIFSDFAYVDKGSYGLFYLKPFGENSPIFEVKTDLKMENMQLCRIIMN
jgi:hypothetical protein